MRSNKRSIARGVALATAFSSLAVQAADRLDDVQVTANRLPQSQTDVLASTTIIDRDEIERSQADSVVELLQGRAGIEMTQSGPPGATSSLFMRGSESDHTLVLVDGVRINPATSGGARLEFLSPAAIERIEIVRGPRAAAYGADAIGGVIQIFTRRGGEGTQATLNLRAGEDSTSKQNLFVSTGDADTRLNASLFHRDGDGFNATQADTSGERDGFERTGGQASLSHRFSDKVSLKLNTLRQNIEADYDSCYPGATSNCNDYITKGYQQTFGGEMDVQLESNWEMAITAGHFDEQYEERADGTRTTLTESHRNEAGIQHRFTRDNGIDVLGIDYRQEHIDYHDDAYGNSYQKDSRENYGIYGMVQRQYGDHEVSGSLRHDDDSLFGDETTGSLAYAYHLTPSQRLGLSYSTAYKAPSLMDLYGPSSWGANPDLDAEKSKNLEAFWSFDKGPWNARATLFENRIDDLIVYTGEYPDAMNRNVDEARIRGAELSGGWHGERLSMKLALTFQNPEVRSDSTGTQERGDRLLNRAERFARWDIDYAVTQTWQVGGTLRGSDQRTTYEGSGSGLTDVAGYGVVDLRTAWQVTPKIELSAKLENAFDKDYQLVDGYNTQDRYFEAGVKLSL